MKRKFIAILTLCLILCLSLCVATSCDFVQNNNQEKNLDYTLNEGDASYCVSGIGSIEDSEIIIPEEYNGKPITKIAKNAFSNTSIVSITIPSSVNNIENAFNSCKSLTKVNYLGSIDQWVEIEFASPILSSTRKLYFNDQIVGQTALTTATKINNFAFSGCNSLTSITIGDNLSSIGEYSFYNCSSLESVTFGNNLSSIGKNAFAYCTSLISLSIPNNITSIDEYAFSNCSSLTNITLPNSITSINSYTFKNCNSLQSIDIPTSVNYIDEYAFSNCTSLESLTIPTNVNAIASYVFENCSSLNNVTINNGITSIGNGAFFGCSLLTSIVIPISVTSVGSYLFVNCTSLQTIYCQAQSRPSDWNTYWNQVTDYDSGNYFNTVWGYNG